MGRFTFSSGDWLCVEIIRNYSKWKLWRIYDIQEWSKKCHFCLEILHFFVILKVLVLRNFSQQKNNFSWNFFSKFLFFMNFSWKSELYFFLSKFELFFQILNFWKFWTLFIYFRFWTFFFWRSKLYFLSNFELFLKLWTLFSFDIFQFWTFIIFSTLLKVLNHFWPFPAPSVFRTRRVQTK